MRAFIFINAIDIFLRCALYLSALYPARIDALEDSTILDGSALRLSDYAGSIPASDARFDKITKLVSCALSVPVSLLTVIDDLRGRQFFKSAFGLPDEHAHMRSTPLSHSFCKHVRDRGEPMAVTDARKHPKLKHNPAIKDLGIISYLGTPFYGEEGEILGALCCVDHQPREWGEEELKVLMQLASLVQDQAQLTSAIRYQAKAERLAQSAVATRARFLSHANHEIRTPLSAISGAADLLSVVSVNEKARNLVNVIQRNTSRLSAVADDLVRIAELDTGSSSDAKEAFNLVELIEDVVGKYSAPAKSKEVGLVFENHLAVPHKLFCDTKIWTNVLTRLVHNAISFTSKGEVRIALEPDPLEEGIVLRVSDTGVGIEQELCRRVFEEFEGHDPRTARRGGGTGLGMSIIRREVELLGGAISVASKPGEGTHFSIFLPDEGRSRSTFGAYRQADDYHQLTCLECGEKLGLLRRHLKQKHGMTPDAYREKWGLARNFEISSVAYKEMRRVALKK